ncbi:MAG: GspE/PulE family protein [Puniceicoccales bacterium]|jgi:general secretion pathway protein E|nr:GspE/PulE family protein [Puniceicoccales bacterium]
MRWSVPRVRLAAIAQRDNLVPVAKIGKKEGGGIPSDGPISRIASLCDGLLARAVAAEASDVHWEWERDSVLVRMRVDGELEPLGRLPLELGRALSVRLKSLAGLSIAEHFRPQDGRFRWRDSDGAGVDLRISILPTRWGESIALRVLDRRRHFLRLEDLGMDAPLVEQLRKLATGSGLLLAIGPTGSGKTTTLYALLEEWRGREQKILTVEDPVEYALEGALQVSVDLAVGRTFSTVLRAFLRHDPDVIFVGEIRDGETAEVALRAALTGHLVLSTLHTATADEALLRLAGMGLDRDLLSTCLRALLGQRLLRLNCPHCAAPLEEEALANLPGELWAGSDPSALRRGTGCVHCAGKGFLGRRAVFTLQGGADCNTPTLAAEGKKLLHSGSLAPEEFLRQLPWDR